MNSSVVLLLCQESLTGSHLDGGRRRRWVPQWVCPVAMVLVLRVRVVSLVLDLGPHRQERRQVLLQARRQGLATAILLAGLMLSKWVWLAATSKWVWLAATSTVVREALGVPSMEVLPRAPLVVTLAVVVEWECQDMTFLPPLGA